jgi:hypothetical protein
LLLFFGVAFGLAVWAVIKSPGYDFDEAPKGPIVLVGSILSLVSISIGIIRLADVWAWVGIFEPKLWLAKRILGL